MSSSAKDVMTHKCFLEAVEALQEQAQGGPPSIAMAASAREESRTLATAVLGRSCAERLAAKARIGEVDPVALLELGALSLSIGVSMTDDELVYMARGVMQTPIDHGFYAQAMRVARLVESASDAASAFNSSLSRMAETMQRAVSSSTTAREQMRSLAHPMSSRKTWVVLDDIVEAQPPPARARGLSDSTRAWYLRLTKEGS